MFYANTSIKKARVAYRGAWTALGHRVQLPGLAQLGHRLAGGLRARAGTPDGSASVWVGNQDRVYGMQWRVALTAAPGQRARCEQDVALYNRSDTRHRFYWWTNAGVRVWDDSRIEYPMRFTASHGFREVDTWPVNRAGVDLTGGRQPHVRARLRVQPRQPRALHGRLPPAHAARASSHYSSPLDAPTKKILVLGQRRRRPRLAQGALRRRERLRRGAGGPLPQPGDLRLPGAAGVDPLHRVLDARARASAASRARTRRRVAARLAHGGRGRGRGPRRRPQRDAAARAGARCA